MTSKTLFFKLIRQDVQKRIWCPIVIFLGYFLALEVNMLRLMGKIEENARMYSYDTIGEYVEKCLFGTDIKLFIMLACIVSFLCAASGFSYLHSRVQIDTYHSLPVNRVQIFWARYVSGILQFFLPFVFHVIVCMGIAAGKAAFSGAAFVNAVTMVGVVTLVFLLCYSVFIVAACLTGNMIINILAGVVLFFYSAVVSLLTNELFRTFFETYIVIGSNGLDYKAFWNFSPVSMLVKLLEPRDTGAFQDDIFFRYNADCLWGIAAAAFVYMLIAFVLCQKRASEAAGKAIAFRWAEPVVKTLLVIPAALLSGLFFKDIASLQSSDAWYLFGICFGYVVAALLLEIVFRLDIKGAFCHKKQFMFNAACLAVVVVVFRYDVLSYDAYVPADSELMSCAVSIENLMAASPAKSTVVGRQSWYTYIGTTEYRMNTVRLQGNPSVMELARKAAAEQLTYQDEDTERDYKGITYGYHLKNGKHIYRMYTIDMADAQTQKLLADIFNDSGYKTGISPMLNSGWKKEYTKMYCSGKFIKKVLDVTPEFQTKLLETYQEEYLQLDFDTVLDTYPVGCISPLTAQEYDADLEWGGGRMSDRYDGSLIYPQFTKTITLLKENGFDIYGAFDMDEIEYVRVQYRKENVMYNGEHPYTTIEYVDVGTIYDKEQQAQILDNALNTSYEWQINAYTDLVDEDFDIIVYTKTNDSSFRYDFRFAKGMIPDFIYELEGYQKINAQEKN